MTWEWRWYWILGIEALIFVVAIGIVLALWVLAKVVDWLAKRWPR